MKAGVLKGLGRGIIRRKVDKWSSSVRIVAAVDGCVLGVLGL